MERPHPDPPPEELDAPSSEPDPQRPHPDPSPEEQGEHTNKLGYRNVDEQEAYSEAGSQGDGPGEPTDRDGGA